MPLRKPNLFLIGAMKSGTTYLSKLLGSHPSIFMCTPEEPSYFVEPRQLRQLWPEMWDQGYWRSKERYLSLFDKGQRATFLGEASTNYTKQPLVGGVAERIWSFNRDCCLVYLIRDPIERTISHYWHMVRYHAERRPLLAAITADPHFSDVSYYAMQLIPFLRRFGRARVKVLTYEALTRDPHASMQALYGWLGVGGSAVDMAGFIEPENVTPEIIHMASWGGAAQRLRQTRPLRRLAPNIPAPLRSLFKRLTTKDVERRTVETLETVRYLQPRQQQQTQELARLLDRDFPEWTTLNSTLAPPGAVCSRC